MAVDQESLLIVAQTRSNHPNHKQEALPTLDAIPEELGTPTAGALDAGYFSEANVQGMLERGIESYIATGREPHHRPWEAWLRELAQPPADDAPLALRMAYKLQTDVGKLIYGARKCTVEPVIGINTGDQETIKNRGQS